MERSYDKCRHKNIKLLGTQRGSRGYNKYYKCLDCGRVLILSEDGVLYILPGIKEK